MHANNHIVSEALANWMLTNPRESKTFRLWKRTKRVNKKISAAIMAHVGAIFFRSHTSVNRVFVYVEWNSVAERPMNRNFIVKEPFSYFRYFLFFSLLWGAMVCHLIFCHRCHWCYCFSYCCCDSMNSLLLYFVFISSMDSQSADKRQ